MSQYELLEIGYAANEAGNTALTIYMSIVSGYLVVAYVVGASLNRFQLVLVNSLFVFFSSAFTYSTFISFVGMRYFSEVAAAVSAEESIMSSEAENTFVVVVSCAMIAGIFGALGFMWDIRRRRRTT